MRVQYWSGSYMSVDNVKLDVWNNFLKHVHFSFQEYMHDKGVVYNETIVL